MTDEVKDQAAATLARIVDGSQPRSLICCGATAEAVARRWCERRPDTRLLRLDAAAPENHQAELAAHELALVSEVLETLDIARGQRLLGLLRNYGSQRIAVLIRDGTGWSLTDFVALGFRQHARLDTAAGGVSLYTYNLDNYNHEREWNNPRHWAHPERWDKARW